MADDPIYLQGNAASPPESINATLGLGANSLQVTSISGTLNGQAITGLSTFNGADNLLTGGTGRFNVVYFGVDQSGLSFTAGGTAYNVAGTANAGTDTLTGPGFTEQISASILQESILCFMQGTRIETARGLRTVETLQPGDLAMTTSGRARPILWIGHRTMRSSEHRMPSDVWPVRVRAGSFGRGLPFRDLMLSPCHPVVVRHDGVEYLVPINLLIHGDAISHVALDEVTYWHVELDAHDILLAEGLPAESFLDWQDIRLWFDGSAGAGVPNPDGLAARCRPVAFDGPVVAAERERLTALWRPRKARWRPWAAVLSRRCAWS